MSVIEHFAGKVPIFGICLGQQSIGAVFGGQIVRAQKVMHGKTSPIYHTGDGVFKDLPSPFTATRYHSLVIDPPSLPKELSESAWTETGGTRQIMGIRHREHKIEGWQFHPESFLTEPGIEMLKKFLQW